MGRPGNAHEIAVVVAFLTSPEGSFITGESVVADGGLLPMAAVANPRAKDG
jgi:NAD(P)-dependent dehydrogenase (short-subunit alcohol dehydrogenase family)